MTRFTRFYDIFPWMALLLALALSSSATVAEDVELPRGCLEGWRSVASELKEVDENTQLESSEDSEAAEIVRYSCKRQGDAARSIVEPLGDSPAECYVLNSDYGFVVGKSKFTGKWVLQSFAFAEDDNPVLQSIQTQTDVNRVQTSSSGLCLWDRSLLDAVDRGDVRVTSIAQQVVDKVNCYVLRIERTEQADEHWFFRSGDFTIHPDYAWQVINGRMDLLNGIGATAEVLFSNEYSNIEGYSVPLVTTHISTANWELEGKKKVIVRKEMATYQPPSTIRAEDFRLSGFGLPEPPIEASSTRRSVVFALMIAVAGIVAVVLLQRTKRA